MGYLYIITHRKTQNMHKIGITKNFSARSKALKVGKQTFCDTLIKFPPDIERLMEKELHAKFANYRLPQSEWFCLDSEAYGNLKFLASLATQKYNGEITYDIETLRKEEPTEQAAALENLCDWLENDVHDHFYDEKYTSNPFLHSFNVEFEKGEDVCRAWVSFIEPQNTVCTLTILGYYCSKKKNTVMYLAEPGMHLESDDDKGNWYSDNYGHEEIELDDYLNILLERLSILTNIDQKLWPSKVWADIVKIDQQLAKYGIVKTE